MSAPLAHRVVARFLVATDPTADLINSLNRLIKKGGLFVSKRQAAFLWNAVRGHGASPAFLHSWAQPYLTTVNSYATVLMAIDERFARGDKSKVRYYAFAYVIDGAGIVASAKVKVAHPKGDEIAAVPSGIESTIFERTESATESYDHTQAERERAERERVHQVQVAKNQEMITRLKHLQDTNQETQDNPIIQSFIEQLEAGRTLSPAQLGLLRKFMEVKIDDSKWKTMRDESFELTEERVIKPAIQFFRSAEIPGFAFAQDAARDIETGWKHFKAKPTSNVELNLPQEFTRLPEQAGWRKPAGVIGFLSLLAKMDTLAKKGEAKAPRTLLKLVRPMQNYHDWLKRLSPLALPRFLGQTS